MEDYYGNESNDYEDVELPEVLCRKSNGTVSCKACKIHFKGFNRASNQIEHLNGVRHKFYLQFYKNTSKAAILVTEAIEQGTLVQSNGKNQHGGIKFYCRSCNVSLEYNSLALLVGHLQNAEHQERVNNQNKEILSTELDIKVMQTSFSTKERTEMEVVDENFDQLTVMFCRPCRVEVSSLNIDSHVTSTRHRTKVDNLEGGSTNQSAFSNSKDMTPDEAIECGIVKMKDLTYFCNVCDKQMNSLKTLKTHLTSSTHKHATGINRGEVKNIVKQEIVNGILIFKFKANEDFPEYLNEEVIPKDANQDTSSFQYTMNQQNNILQGDESNQDNMHTQDKNERPIHSTDYNPEERKDQNQSGGTKAKSLYVINLPTMTEVQIWDLFEPYGEIKDLRLILKKGKTFAGKCYLNFSDEETAEAVKKATDQLEVAPGQKITVSFKEQINFNSGRGHFHKYHGSALNTKYTESTKAAGEGKECASKIDSASKEFPAYNPEEINDHNQSGESIAKSLYIVNLPSYMTDLEIWDLFEPYGEIKDLRILLKKGKGFIGSCYLDFFNEENAGAVKEASDQYEVADGQKITVSFAKSPKPEIMYKVRYFRKYHGGAHKDDNYEAFAKTAVLSSAGGEESASKIDAASEECPIHLSAYNPEERKDDNKSRDRKHKWMNPISKSLFVSDLPVTMTDLEIWNIFEPYGEIKDLRLCLKGKQKTKKTFRGRCYLDFADEETASAVREATDQFEVAPGQRIIVSFAAPQQTESIFQGRRYHKYKGSDHSLRRYQGGAPEISKGLFISDLPRTITDLEIWNIFEPYGEIQILRLPLRKAHESFKGRTTFRGRCYLDFADEETASAVREATDQFEVAPGQRINVSFTWPRPPEDIAKFKGRTFHKYKGGVLSNNRGGVLNNNRGGAPKNNQGCGPKNTQGGTLKDNSYEEFAKAAILATTSNAGSEKRRKNENRFQRDDMMKRQRGEEPVSFRNALNSTRKPKAPRLPTISDSYENKNHRYYDPQRSYQQYPTENVAYYSERDYGYQQTSSHSIVGNRDSFKFAQSYNDHTLRRSEVYDYQHMESRIQPEDIIERNRERDIEGMPTISNTSSTGSIQKIETSAPFSPFQAVLILSCLCDDLGIFGETVQAICDNALENKDNILKLFKESEVRMTMKIVSDRLKTLINSASDKLSKEKFKVGLEKVSLLLQHSVDP